MEIGNIVRNCNLFVEGKGYAGKSEELTLPKLTLKTEEIKAAGMDVPLEIDMGMEKIEASFDLHGYSPDVLKLWGLTDGKAPKLLFKAAQQEMNGKVVPIVVDMQGMVKEVDMGAWKPGERAKTKFTVNLKYYKLSVGDKIIYEIDVLNMIRNINGKDQLKEIRDAIS